MKPVSNKTEDAVTLGGVEIAPASQVHIRTALITEDEKQAIIDSGAVIKFGMQVIEVNIPKEKEDTDTSTKDTNDGNMENQGNNQDASSDSVDASKENGTVKHVAYPKSLITAKGNLTGANKAKEALADLAEAHGENILSDNDFKEMYPGADIEQYRVEEV